MNGVINFNQRRFINGFLSAYFGVFNSALPCVKKFFTAKHGSRWSRRKTITSITLFLLCVTAGSISIVIGCGWSGTSRSVRFNGVFTEREFDLLPPFSEHLGDDYPRGVNGVDESEDYYRKDYEARQIASEKAEKEIKDTRTRARLSETSGDLRQARVLWQTYLRLTENIHTGTYSTASKDDHEPSRNSIIDRLDALAELEHGASPDAVRQYLKARDAYDKGATDGADVSDTSEALFGVEGAKAFDDASHDRRLNDNAFYLWCAALYRMKNYKAAAFNFAKLIDQNRRSEKRDAALLMKGLAWMRQSTSFREDDDTAVSSPACVECADVAWHQAHNAFGQLLREYPRGRYAADALGWLGYLNLRVGRTGDALAEYYRLLTPGNNHAARFNALVSLRLTRSDATPADMERIEEILTREPQTALAYVYHNLYNYTFSAYLNFDTSDAINNSDYYSSSSSEYNHRVRKHRAAEAKKEELERIARFAERLMKTYPRTHVEAAFMLRLAQANLELDREQAAWDLAKRAMINGLAAELRPEALWVQAVAAHRLKQHDAARHTLTRLIKDYPHHRMIEGARRQLAIAAEDAGDRAAALEQYFALDYQEDIAYFVDVLMTPEELRAYIDDHAQDKNIDELRYALGVRYMRAGLWTEAREAYAHVRTSSAFNNYYSSPCNDVYGGTSDCDPKDPRDEEGVSAEWVRRDLKTINDLESFERYTAQAISAETKAETMYQMASYLYDGSELLFYNPAAWGGTRYWNLSYSEPFRAPGDVGIYQAYLRLHSTRYRALDIYLRIARDYPRTRAAPDALYTAAVCYERLANGRDEWNDIFDATAYTSGRTITYADVRRTYPRYQLPRGTYGWQPSTRTVNGGAGWASPPKPQPRLTRGQRGERKLKPFWNYAVVTIKSTQSTIANFWQHTARRWFLLALFFVATLITARLAARARHLLRVQIARMEYAHAHRTGAYNARRFLRRARRHAARLRIEPRDEAFILATAFTRIAVRYSLPLLRDHQARAIIIFNIIAHTMFALSMMSLVEVW